MPTREGISLDGIDKLDLARFAMVMKITAEWNEQAPTNVRLTTGRLVHASAQIASDANRGKSTSVDEDTAVYFQIAAQTFAREVQKDVEAKKGTAEEQAARLKLRDASLRVAEYLRGQMMPSDGRKGEVPLRRPNFCSDCGGALGESMNFCPGCGSKVVIA